MINNIVIIDTETTDILPENGEVIEIAAILYNVPTKTILQQISTLIPYSDMLSREQRTNKAFNVNRISDNVLNLSDWDEEPPREYEINYPHSSALDIFEDLTNNADYIIAHNADFDKSWIVKLCKERTDFNFNLNKPWICSCHDFKWPEQCNGAKKLTDIALSLDVPVVSAHRALTDCILLANSFSKIVDLEYRLEQASKPREIYIANLSFEKREIAKKNGFIWDNLIPKKWAKKLTEEEAKTFDFPVYKA